ncbi:hypothetical protein V6N13_072131 [Hibiscus sabdariffa]
MRLVVQDVVFMVAEEIGIQLVEEVGYTILFEDISNSDITKLKFLTKGILLGEMLNDPLLMMYDVNMVDEAYGRSISIEILFYFLKKIQKHQHELRLVISSSTNRAKSRSTLFKFGKRRQTLEGEELRSNWEHAILSVDGNEFSGENHYVSDHVKDNAQAGVSTMLLLHDKKTT